MKEAAKEYFDAFNSKDLDRLGELYAEDVKLIDWVSCQYGKEDVLFANKQLFNSYSHLELHHEDSLMYEGDNSVACEIAIILASGNHPGAPERAYAIVDVTEFNDEGKISTIKAYVATPEGKPV